MTSDAEEIVRLNEKMRISQKQPGKPKQGRSTTVHEMLVGARSALALDAEVFQIATDPDLSEAGKQRKIAEIRDAHAAWKATGFSTWMLPADNPNRRQ